MPAGLLLEFLEQCKLVLLEQSVELVLFLVTFALLVPLLILQLADHLAVFF